MTPAIPRDSPLLDSRRPVWYNANSGVGVSGTEGSALDRPVKIDAGPKLHQVSRETRETIDQTLATLKQHCEAVAGTDYYGEIWALMTWRGGQCTRGHVGSPPWQSLTPG